MRSARLGSLAAALTTAATVLLLARCSLIVGNFQECTHDSDCPAGKVCQASYCIPIPAGCSGVPDAGVLGVYGSPDQANAIHLGALLNITNGGVINTTRIQHLNALVLALNEINQRGVGGRPFALHVCDTGGDNTLLVSQAQWMIDKLDVPAVIVTASSPVLAVAPITTAAKVLLMSPTATSPEITGVGGGGDAGLRYVWRTAPSDALQARVISEVLTGVVDAGLPNVSRLGVLYENGTYGQDLQALLFADMTGAAVQGFSYARGGDVSAAVSSLNAFQPQLSVLIGFPQDVPRILDAGMGTAHLSRASGHQWFFTDAAKDPAIISSSPPSELQGSFGTAPAQGAGLAYGVFRNAFIGTYGLDPSGYGFAANCYDAMYCIALAAASAVGPSGNGLVTGTSLAMGMTKLSSGTSFLLGNGNFTSMTSALESGQSIDISGASGALDFNPATGEAPAPIELWQVDGGSFRTAAIIDAGF